MEIEGYKLYRGESESSLSQISVVNDLQFNDTSVMNGQIYYYQVSAFNPLGEGPMSNLVEAMPEAGVVRTVPSAPLNLEAQAGQSQITLAWDQPEDNGGAIITHYAIYRGTSSGSETLLITINNTLGFTDASVTNHVTSYYQVSAINTVGEGPRSNEAYATPFIPTVPSSPQDLEAEAGDSYALLAWTSPLDDGGSTVTAYNLYRGTSPTSLAILINLGNVLAYNDSSVTNGVTYYYQVKAINSVGEGAGSAIISATPEATTVPTSPQNPQASAGDSYVLINWTTPLDDGGSDINSYTIYRGTDSYNLTLLATVASTQTSYNDTSVENGQTYYYKITAVNDQGESPQSTMVVDTPGGEEGGATDNTVLIVLGVILVIAVIVILVFVLRRR